MRNNNTTTTRTLELVVHLSCGVEGSANGFGRLSLVQCHARDEGRNGVGLCRREGGDVWRRWMVEDGWIMESGCYWMGVSECVSQCIFCGVRKRWI